MSAGSGGRPAALPAPGSHRETESDRLDGFRVRFVAETPIGQMQEFEFADWPVSEALRAAFAAAFA